MKKSILSIVTILAVFTMVGCMGETPCFENYDGMCFRGKDMVCNMAISPPSPCDQWEIPEEECDIPMGDFIASGTCQDLQPVGEPCAEDDDCEEELVCIDEACAESV